MIEGRHPASANKTNRRITPRRGFNIGLRRSVEFFEAHNQEEYL